MSLSDSPKYINGIPVRTIGGEEGDTPTLLQQDDFEEEKEGRRGIFTVKTDGFCLRQGSDIMSHMDKRGSFHPRRYIVQFDIGFNNMEEGAYETVNLVICEDGPRITISFPRIGPITQTLTAYIPHNVSKKLPKRICPSEIWGDEVSVTCMEEFNVTSGTQQNISLFMLSPYGDVRLIRPGLPYGTTTYTTTTIYPFCFVYDTLRP